MTCTSLDTKGLEQKKQGEKEQPIVGGITPEMFMNHFKELKEWAERTGGAPFGVGGE